MHKMIKTKYTDCIRNMEEPLEATHSEEGEEEEEEDEAEEEEGDEEEKDEEEKDEEERPSKHPRLADTGDER